MAFWDLNAKLLLCGSHKTYGLIPYRLDKPLYSGSSFFLVRLVVLIMGFPVHFPPCLLAATRDTMASSESPTNPTSSRCPMLCKTRSNSFHSTLEPNTEVFSKVSRSLAQFTLVNSVSTLLNKGGMSCNCPRASQDFFVNQNKQASAQLLCSSLVLSRHERSEGRRNSCEAEKAHLLRATRTSSRMSQGHLWCLALIMANSNMPSMPKPCHKHAKVMSQTCQGSCQCLFR